MGKHLGTNSSQLNFDVFSPTGIENDRLLNDCSEKVIMSTRLITNERGEFMFVSIEIREGKGTSCP